MPLPCLSCRDPLTPAEMVQGAFSSVAGEGLVDFRCARCGERGLARLSDGLAEIGRQTSEGFKRLSFEVVPDLAVAPRSGGLTIWHAGTQRNVPEREECVLVPAPPPRTPAG